MIYKLIDKVHPLIHFAVTLALHPIFMGVMEPITMTSFGVTTVFALPFSYYATKYSKKQRWI